MKVNRLLSLLIVFIILFSFLFLISKKNLSFSLLPRPLSLAMIKNAYKEDNEIFSEKIIFFCKRIFFSIFVIEVALLLFFRIFVNIDYFHLKEKNKVNEKCLIEADCKLSIKEERLRTIMDRNDLRMKMRMKRKFFYRYKSLVFENNIE